MSIAETLADAIDDDDISYAQLEAVVTSGNKLTARAIRNAVMPARATLRHISVITNADYYAAAALVFPNIAAISATQEQDMQTNVPFQSVDYVYGRDINSLSKADLIASIKRANSEIDDLAAVGVASTFVDDQIAGLKASITKMVARLDA
jgi:flavin-binding protein dodecin